MVVVLFVFVYVMMLVGCSVVSTTTEVYKKSIVINLCLSFRFQEIVPLNAGNIFGSEDNSPIAVWEHIIRETLNKICPDKPQYKCHSDPPSPSRFNPSDYVMVMKDELLSESDSDNYGELHPLIKQNDDIAIDNDVVHDKTYENFSAASNGRVHKGKDFSRMDSVKTSDQSPNLSYEKDRSKLEETTKLLYHPERLGMIWPEQPLDMMAQCLRASTSLKALATPASLKSTVNFPNDDLSHQVNSDNGVIKSKRPCFLRIVSKQMVGIYLSIWVRRDLRKHIQNLRVSTVGVGAMGYMGNKASINFNPLLLLFNSTALKTFANHLVKKSHRLISLVLVCTSFYLLYMLA
jgi:hypothetical protein